MSDLISRSALIKRRRKVVEYDEAGFSVDYFAVSVEEINNAPTVEAKPVVYGEWIDTCPDYHTGFGNSAHRCSNCSDYYTTEPEDLFFCPRCGANMTKKPVGKTDKLHHS